MARFQCIVYRAWDPELHARMLPALARNTEDVRSLVAPVAGVERVMFLGGPLG
jgi:hypothetical protein